MNLHEPAHGLPLTLSIEPVTLIVEWRVYVNQIFLRLLELWVC